MNDAPETGRLRELLCEAMTICDRIPRVTDALGGALTHLDTMNNWEAEEVQPGAFWDSNVEERHIAAAENACPHCGGSGHKDDVAPAEPQPLPGYKCIKRHGLKPGDRVLCVSSEWHWWTVGKTYEVVSDRCLRDDDGDVNLGGGARFTPAPAPTVTQAVEVKWPAAAPREESDPYWAPWYDGWDAARARCIAAYDAALAQAPAPAGETAAEVLRRAADIYHEKHGRNWTATATNLRDLADALEARPSPDRETA